MTPLDIVWQWPETPITIVVILVLAIALRWVILRAIKRATDVAVQRAKDRRPQTQDTQLQAVRHAARTATMGSLLRSITNVVICVLAVLTIMAAMDIPLAPLLASAGIGGIALGFGAQTLVKDYLSGIFMIVEDQYGVGDLIDAGEVTGTVEDVGLRVTRLRDASGQVWYVRNGEITRIGNQTQGWSTAIVDVPVDPDEDSVKVIEVLGRVCAEVHADPELATLLLEEPRVVGVQSVDAGRMIIRIVAKTHPNEHFVVQRAILDRELQALREAGIKGPRVVPSSPSL
jgi:moderate conductance mechanosensitive channel